jgi:hypothetical protein
MRWANKRAPAKIAETQTSHLSTHKQHMHSQQIRLTDLKARLNPSLLLVSMLSKGMPEQFMVPDVARVGGTEHAAGNSDMAASARSAQDTDCMPDNSNERERAKVGFVPF